jgi:hypothetical protein
MTTKVNFSEIKDLKKDEITLKIRSGEIKVPEKGVDRDAFLQFASADPNSDIRNKFLTETPSEEKKPETPEQKSTPAVTDEIPSEPESKAKDPAKEIDPEPEMDDDKRVESLRELISKQRQQIDKYNAERGSLGQSLKEMKEKLAALEKERSEIKKSDVPSEVSKPVRPKRPKPSDFDEGILDDKYQAELDKYESSMEKFESDYESYLDSKRPKWAEKVEEKLSKVDEVSTFVDASKRELDSRIQEEAWSEVWNKTIPEFQKEYGYETKVKPRDISDAFGVLNNASATTEQKEHAQLFIKSVPKTDLDAYEKIRIATESYYDFSSGIPKARYRSLKGCLIDTGLVDTLGKSKKTGLTASEEKALLDSKKKQESEEATVLSGSSLSGGDDLQVEVMSSEQKKQTLATLVKEWKSAVDAGEKHARAFEASPKWATLKKLRLDVMGRLPQFHGSKRY